jgi:hypothetical protein
MVVVVVERESELELEKNWRQSFQQSEFSSE